MNPRSSPSVAKVRQVKGELSERILQSDDSAANGIVGVGVGEKVTDKRLTGLRCITVLVGSKRSAGSLAEGQFIPPEINGVRTDVQVVGALRAGVAGDGTDPVVVDSDVGQYELRCAHSVDMSTAALSVPLLDINVVDCAMVDLPRLGGVTHRPCAEFTIGQAEFDTTVYMYGSSDRYAAGVVTSVDTDVILTCAGQRRVFTNQIIIAPFGRDVFEEPAVGGALAIGRATGEAIGMIIGGSRRIAIANHLDDVLDALGVTCNQRFDDSAQQDGALFESASNVSPTAAQFQPQPPVVDRSQSARPPRSPGSARPRRLAP